MTTQAQATHPAPGTDPAAIAGIQGSRRQQAAAELLSRTRAYQSLHEFTRQAWRWIEGRKPFIDSWYIGAVAEHLEAVYYGQIRNLLINQPPRTLKSTLLAITLPAWVWARDPEKQFVYTSYASPLSVRDSRKCRQLIKSKWYQDRWGDRFVLAPDQDAKMRFDNNMGGYRIASSNDGSNTGEGGNFICFDDPNNARDQSDVMLQSVIDFFTGTMSTRLNDPNADHFIVNQQRLHERDLSGYLLETERDEWVHLMLPLEYEPKRRCVTVALPSTGGKKWKDPRAVEGETLCPVRWTPTAVARLKKRLSTDYAISGQLQQRPSPGEGGLIKRSYFRIWKEYSIPKPEWVLQSWDPALSDEEGRAYSACTTWAVFRNEHGVPNVILLSSYRERLEYPELRQMAKRLARDWNDYVLLAPLPTHKLNLKNKADLVLIENKANGKSLIQDLSRAGIVPVPFNPDKQGDKMQRVRTITHHLEAGTVWVPGAPPSFVEPVAWGRVFIDQCCSFPKAESRDLVDTMTQALIRLSSSGFIYHPDDQEAGPDTRGAITVAREAFY